MTLVCLQYRRQARTAAGDSLRSDSVAFICRSALFANSDPSRAIHRSLRAHIQRHRFLHSAATRSFLLYGGNDYARRGQNPVARRRRACTEGEVVLSPRRKQSLSMNERRFMRALTRIDSFTMACGVQTDRELGRERHWCTFGGSRPSVSSQHPGRCVTGDESDAVTICGIRPASCACTERKVRTDRRYVRFRDGRRACATDSARSVRHRNRVRYALQQCLYAGRQTHSRWEAKVGRARHVLTLKTLRLANVLPRAYSSAPLLLHLVSSSRPVPLCAFRGRHRPVSIWESASASEVSDFLGFP